MDVKITFKRTEEKKKPKKTPHTLSPDFISPIHSSLETPGKNKITMTAWFREVHKYLHCWKIKENAPETCTDLAPAQGA